MDDFEKKILAKIDSGKELSERELCGLVFDYEFDQAGNGSCGRWAEHMNTIVLIGERYFSIKWDRGLTECQENEFENQPVEVFKKEYEKTITVTEWIERNENATEAWI